MTVHSGVLAQQRADRMQRLERAAEKVGELVGRGASAISLSSKRVVVEMTGDQFLELVRTLESARHRRGITSS